MAKKFDPERRLMIGRKLALARDLAGLKQEQVMIKIFGSALDSKQKNRISEIENGKSMPDAELLQALCELYVVSADWIIGFTTEPELDKTASIAGILFNSMGDMLNESINNAAAHLTMACAKHIASFPKAAQVALLQQSKALVKATRLLDQEANDKIQPELAALMEVIRECDTNRAIQMRNLQMSIDDVYQRDEADTQQRMLLDLVMNSSGHKRHPMTSLPDKEEIEAAQIGLFESAG